VNLEVERSDVFELVMNNNNNNNGPSMRSGGRGRSSASRSQLTVCARTTATHSFVLVARQLGYINFTVTVILSFMLLTCLLTFFSSFLRSRV